MSQTKPFGNPATADMLVIGHDPRLQSSQAEAEYAFFLDYLQRYAAAPAYGPEKRKYGLANALLDYVSALAGCRVDDIPCKWQLVERLPGCEETLPSRRRASRGRKTRFWG